MIKSYVQNAKTLVIVWHSNTMSFLDCTWQNSSNQFMCATRWKRLKISALDKYIVREGNYHLRWQTFWWRLGIALAEESLVLKWGSRSNFCLWQTLVCRMVNWHFHIWSDETTIFYVCIESYQYRILKWIISFLSPNITRLRENVWNNLTC